MELIKKILKSLGLLILYLLFASICALLLKLIGINYETWNDIYKYIFIFTCNIIVILIICIIYKETLKKDFKKFFNKNIFNNLENSFKYWLIGFAIMVISNLILTLITGGIAGNEEAVRKMIKIAPLYMGFEACIYAPLLEELIFRKSIRDIINDKWKYIIVSGLLFGFLHVVGKTPNLIDFLYIIPYSSLGLAFAYSYYKNNNIFSTITMHAMHNTFSFILLIISGLLHV